MIKKYQSTEYIRHNKKIIVTGDLPVITYASFLEFSQFGSYQLSRTYACFIRHQLENLTAFCGHNS